jgi:hypothetical protein
MKTVMYQLMIENRVIVLHNYVSKTVFMSIVNVSWHSVVEC